ncbi:MAG: c-type cytochrome [Gammaproteobacteria bacterium]
MSQDKNFYMTFVAVLAALTVLALAMVFIASSLTSDVSDYKPEKLVLENIHPVGKVNIAGESAPAAAPAAAPAVTAAAAVPAAAEALSGEQIYQRNCVACHATGAAGAPKLGDVATWAPRIAQGMDTLLANATNGLNAMPPKGLCMTCSADDMMAVVEYMVEKSK